MGMLICYTSQGFPKNAAIHSGAWYILKIIRSGYAPYCRINFTLALPSLFSILRMYKPGA